MLPRWRLSDERCLGLKFTPGDEEIHILVKLAWPEVVIKPPRKKIRLSKRIFRHAGPVRIDETCVPFDSYHRLRTGLRGMTPLEWDTLLAILDDDDKLGRGKNPRGTKEHRRDTPSNGYCDPTRYGASCFKLAVVSEMMRRIVIEEQPARHIQQSIDSDDPVLLLLAALRQVNPRTLSHSFVRNRQSPSESIFHFELYATIRDILRQSQPNQIICVEAKTPAQKRADIIVSGGATKSAFDLKVSKLLVSQIKEAVEQADHYRQQLEVDRMLLLNFVLIGHSMNEVIHVDGYDKVQIIHVRFPDTCNEFQLDYHEGGNPRTAVIQCGVFS